jgi:preprotein translocase subunit SecG
MTILKVAQLVLAVALIVAILLQNRGVSLSGSFGGSGNVFLTKRGLEKKLFYSTIVLSALFISVSFAITLIS